MAIPARNKSPQVSQRTVLIGGGMISSFPRPPLFIVFDLGALDGIFRVVVFIAVRLALLGMGGRLCATAGPKGRA